MTNADAEERAGGAQPPTAAPAVLKLINDQLAEERNTKTSLEARAVSVITTSGTLTTLLLALAALVTDRDDFQIPLLARILLVLAVVAFLVAAVLAILAARPQAYREVEVDSLREITDPAVLAAPSTAADPKIAKALVEIIERARQRNGLKARRLRDAVIAEVAGTVVVGGAVITALVSI